MRLYIHIYILLVEILKDLPLTVQSVEMHNTGINDKVIKNSLKYSYEEKWSFFSNIFLYIISAARHVKT